MRNAQRLQLDEYLAEIRRDIFGSPEPPFGNLEDAEAWLREESESGSAQTSDEERRELTMRLEAIGAEVRALSKLAPAGAYLEWGMKWDLVSFYSESDNAVCRVPATTKNLRLLTEAARYGADFAGVSDANISARLLIGSALAVGRQSMRLIQNPIGARRVRATTHDPDVHRWVTAVSKLRPLDRELLRFVAERANSGSAPPESPGQQGKNVGVRRYWEEVLEGWNVKHSALPHWQFHHWTSVRRRYEQLLGALPERPLAV